MNAEIYDEGAASFVIAIEPPEGKTVEGWTLPNDISKLPIWKFYLAGEK